MPQAESTGLAASEPDSDEAATPAAADSGAVIERKEGEEGEPGDSEATPADSQDEQLLAVRMRGRKMGLRLESLFGGDAGDADAKGAMVVSVAESSPAYPTVRQGDVVVSVSSVPDGPVALGRLDDSPDLTEAAFDDVLVALRAAARDMKAGGEAVIRFYRPDEGADDVGTPPQGFAIGSEPRVRT